MSPSSRRAWIEIFVRCWFVCCANVALLAEGVDRNDNLPDEAEDEAESPSSRRAWIEIGNCMLTSPTIRSPSSRRAWIEISV